LHDPRRYRDGAPVGASNKVFFVALVVALAAAALDAIRRFPRSALAAAASMLAVTLRFA
jgi:hypothetical protein